MSNLPFLFKFIEKFTKGQLQAQLIETNILDLEQPGFRPGQGIKTISVALMNGLVLADWGKTSILIFLIISGTFDTVDHEILLSCLREVAGIQGNTLIWSETFLEGCTQQIAMENYTSSHKDEFPLWPFSTTYSY